MMHIFGRDKDIRRIQRRLEEKSVIFVAERRIGKTTVLHLLLEKQQPECIMIYRDLEKIKSVDELEREVYKSISDYISAKEKAKLKGFDKLGELLSSFEAKDIKYSHKKDWKEGFENAIRSVCKLTDKRVVFLWDELPYMLQNIHQQDIENNTRYALDIVDILRTLSNEVKNLRFIFTGSIGLHHIEKLITKDTTSNPFNNMDRIELKPLKRKYAQEMIHYHMKREEIEISEQDTDLIIDMIYEKCDGIPFYMERVIKRLSVSDEEIIDYSVVQDEIELMIVDGKNELEMEHFVKRLEIYYEESVVDVNGNEIPISTLAKSLLDYFAFSNVPLTQEMCFAYLKTLYPIDDITIVQELIKLLIKDYYIQANQNKEYQFTFSVIKRWWLKNEVSIGGGLNG
jgi:hypothetical protein